MVPPRRCSRCSCSGWRSPCRFRRPPTGLNSHSMVLWRTTCRSSAMARPRRPLSTVRVLHVRGVVHSVLGLLGHFCSTGDGRNCTKNKCAFCGPKSECAGWGCFTTAGHECNCNDPPSPLPPGANTAASFVFSCGQLGGSAAPGVPVMAWQCKCLSDWPRGCENCYRWWSAVTLEAMVNYALAADLPPTHPSYRQTLAVHR